MILQFCDVLDLYLYSQCSYLSLMSIKKYCKLNNIRKMKNGENISIWKDNDPYGYHIFHRNVTLQWEHPVIFDVTLHQHFCDKRLLYSSLLMVTYNGYTNLLDYFEKNNLLGI